MQPTRSNTGSRKQEINSEDVAVRLAFVRSLSQTAESLGPERFREEIIPDLKDLLDDEEDVTLALAEELGKTTIEDFLGGAAHLPLILPHLEALAKFEDTSVRDKAVSALTFIASRLSEEGFEKNFVELVNRLIDSDWFSPKASACGLLSVAYPRASAAWQHKLLVEFKRCCEDQTPMVRRSAAAAIKNLSTLVNKAELPILIEDFKNLALDDQDSVRLLAVENCVSIASVVSDEEKNSVVKPIVISCGKDKSWRVRYMVASTFTKLVDVLGQQITQNDLVSIFVQLLKDNEAEVRGAAASKVSGVCKLVDRETVIKEIIPCIKSLATDEAAPVRSSLASDVMGLAPIFGKEGTNEHLLELFLQLLKDETPDVRLNVLGKLDEVTQVLGLEQLSQFLLPSIMELAEDRQWRIRAATLDHIPLLAEQLGVDFFNDKLSSICMSWLNDCVHSIREAATVNFQKLTKSFGAAWAKSHIIPKIMEQMKNRNYLYRIISLNMITALAPEFPPQDVQRDLIPLVYTLSADPIANIRVQAAKTFGSLIPALETPFVQNDIIPFLTDKLLVDKDRDVLYFANVALQAARKKQ